MKKVIVTGSSRGIGRAIALNLAAAGYDPIIHCVKGRDAAEEVAAQVRALGGAGDILQFDVADRAATRAALEGWLAANGAPYGVVLNAGIAADNAFPAMEDDEWDRVIRTDLDSFYNVLKPLVLPMVQAHIRGRIIPLVPLGHYWQSGADELFGGEGGINRRREGARRGIGSSRHYGELCRARRY